MNRGPSSRINLQTNSFLAHDFSKKKYFDTNKWKIIALICDNGQRELRVKFEFSIFQITSETIDNHQNDNCVTKKWAKSMFVQNETILETIRVRKKSCEGHRHHKLDGPIV